MSEPVQHVVWDEIQKHNAAPVHPPPNVPPAIPRDPLTSFENFIWQIRTHLSTWMTFSKKDRMDKCYWFVNTFVDTAMKMTPDRRHKTLCFIIFMESHHPLGDRDVAAMAFKGLFGENLKTEPKTKEDKKAE